MSIERIGAKFRRIVDRRAGPVVAKADGARGLHRGGGPKMQGSICSACRHNRHYACYSYRCQCPVCKK